LDEGLRIGDAVLLAGGLREDAAAAAVNLAEPVSDGMQVNIPTNEEVKAGGGLAVEGVCGKGSSVGAGAAAGRAPQGKVNLNTADAATLQTLDGVGPSTAAKIIDYRSANGPFKTIEDLKKVSGIGDKKFAAIASKIVV
jgi:competence protein ComEA